MEFRVPFLSIPVKRAMETAQGWTQGLYGVPPSANVNVGALVLGGAVIFGAAVIIPLFSSFISKKTGMFGETHERNERSKLLIRMIMVVSGRLQLCYIRYFRNVRIENVSIKFFVEYGQFYSLEYKSYIGFEIFYFTTI